MKLKCFTRMCHKIRCYSRFQAGCSDFFFVLHAVFSLLMYHCSAAIRGLTHKIPKKMVDFENLERSSAIALHAMEHSQHQFWTTRSFVKELAFLQGTGFYLCKAKYFGLWVVITRDTTTGYCYLESFDTSYTQHVSFHIHSLFASHVSADISMT